MHRIRSAIVVFSFVVLAVVALTACGTKPAVAPIVPLAPTPNGAAPAQANQAACKQAEDAGMAAYQAGDFAAAVTLAQEAVTADPTCPDGWEFYRLATMTRAAGEYLRNLPAARYQITPEQSLAALKQDYVVVDVREPDEFTAGHIEGAVNVPLRSITQQLNALPAEKDAPILLYCRSGHRSAHALVILRMLGYTNVYHVQGGFEAYQTYLKEHVEPAATPTPIPTPMPEGDADDCS